MTSQYLELIEKGWSLPLKGVSIELHVLKRLFKLSLGTILLLLEKLKLLKPEFKRKKEISQLDNLSKNMESGC